MVDPECAFRPEDSTWEGTVKCVHYTYLNVYRSFGSEESGKTLADMLESVLIQYQRR